MSVGLLAQEGGQLGGESVPEVTDDPREQLGSSTRRSLVLCPPTVTVAAASVAGPWHWLCLGLGGDPMGTALDFCCSLCITPELSLGKQQDPGSREMLHAPMVGSWHSRVKFR